MTCKCGSKRLMNLSGKSSDLHSWEIEHLKHEGDGYAPDIPHVCDGDYIDFTFCLDCGQIQHFSPVSDEYLITELNIEEEEEDPNYNPELGY